MKRPRRSHALALLALLSLGSLACAGPRPEVESHALRAHDGATVVDVVVVNRGDGEGQVAVEVTLRAEGAVVARAEAMVELGPRERVAVPVALDTPLKASLSADVRARYPVD